MTTAITKHKCTPKLGFVFVAACNSHKISGSVGEVFKTGDRRVASLSVTAAKVTGCVLEQDTLSAA